MMGNSCTGWKPLKGKKKRRRRQLQAADQVPQVRRVEVRRGPGKSQRSNEMEDESDDSGDADPGEVRTKRKAEEQLVSDDTTLEDFRKEVVKRSTQKGAEESPKKGQGMDEGSGKEEERSEKMPRAGEEARGSASRVMYHIRRFAKSEEPEAHGDDYVDLEETKLFLEESKELQEKWKDKVCLAQKRTLRLLGFTNTKTDLRSWKQRTWNRVGAKSEKTEVERLLGMGVLRKRMGTWPQDLTENHRSS